MNYFELCVFLGDGFDGWMEHAIHSLHMDTIQSDIAKIGHFVLYNSIIEIDVGIVLQSNDKVSVTSS